MAFNTIVTTKRFVCIYSGTDLYTVLALEIGTSIDIETTYSYIEHATTVEISGWMTANSIETFNGYASFQVPIQIAIDDADNTLNPERSDLDTAIALPDEIDEGPSEV